MGAKEALALILALLTSWIFCGISQPSVLSVIATFFVCWILWLVAIHVIAAHLSHNAAQEAQAREQRRLQADHDFIQRISGRPADQDPLESAKEKLLALVEAHRAVLVAKRMRGIRVDEYKRHDASAWNADCQTFIHELFIPQLTQLEILKVQQFGLSAFTTAYVEHPIRSACQSYTARAGNATFDDNMSPREYEIFCATRFKEAGWNATVTPPSADQGVDVIATKSGKRLVVQCKKYSRSVGNSAVQEVIAGMRYHCADFALVVSTAGYTKSARALAASASVLLIHHDEIHTVADRLDLAPSCV